MSEWLRRRAAYGAESRFQGRLRRRLRRPGRRPTRPLTASLARRRGAAKPRAGLKKMPRPRFARLTRSDAA